MGWSKRDDGSLDGDTVADRVAETITAIAEESHKRARTLPTGEAVLEAFVAALGLDGARAPFYEEPRRIDQIIARRAKREVRIDGRHAEPWIVLAWYELLDEVADLYDEAWQRPPRIRELLHYLASHLETDPNEDDATTRPILDDGWQVHDADIVLTDRKKPRERKPAPEVAPPPATEGPRVRHPKFGEGIVVAEGGDRLTVDFAGERRVLLRNFVTPVD